MTDPIDFGALEARLRAAPDITTRRLYFAALLSKEGGFAEYDFVVGGGSAIEVYTSGEYTSGDIDIVSGDNERLRAILKRWHFKREGRGFENVELGLFVDLVRSPYTGDILRTRPFKTPYGIVRLAAVEDLIVKRLASVKFWGATSDLDQAKLLALQYFDGIEWDYLEAFARQQDVWDLGAFLREQVERAVRKQ